MTTSMTPRRSRSGSRWRDRPTSASTRTPGRRARPASSSTRSATAPACARSSPSTSAARRRPWPSTMARCWSRSTGSRSSVARDRCPRSRCSRSKPARAAAPTSTGSPTLIEATGFVAARAALQGGDRASLRGPGRGGPQRIACRGCRPRPASRPTTPWVRPDARCCACTSHACSSSRPGRARARTPRTCTRCAWPRAACVPPGASSMVPTGPRSSAATSRSCARSPACSARCATSTSCSRTSRATSASCPDPAARPSSHCEPPGAGSVRSPASGCWPSSTPRHYREFVDDYLDFTESPGAAEIMTPLGQPSLVRDTAGSRILAAYEHVRAYETIITWADVPTLHALRIETKRLRYTMEYFSEVLPVTVAQAHRADHRDAGPPGPDERRRRGRHRHP